MFLRYQIISFLFSLSVFYALMLIVETLVSGSSTGSLAIITGNPLLFLFFIPIFIGVWVGVDSFLMRIRKMGNKVLIFGFFSLIIVPLGIVAGLHNGLFDSIKLLEPSGMDLYNCWVLLNIKNNGLTDVQISKIEIGDLVCDISSQWYNDNLKRDRNGTLFIYYAHEGFMWESIWGWHNPYHTTGRFHSNLEITPATFAEGKIPVVFHTDGLLTCRFEIEARFSKSEEIHGFNVSIINLGQGKVEDQNYCLPDMSFNFDMAPSSKAYIYSVDIGNLTIKLGPPLLIPDYGFHRDFSLYLNPDHITVYGPSTDAIPSQPLSLPVFRVGETYDVTIRTMANNNYKTSITMMEDWGF